MALNSISIHAPREGGDNLSRGYKPQTKDFNPRPPRGGRLEGIMQLAAASGISIHAPREGGDSSPHK